MKRAALALSSVALCVVAIAGCSSEPADDTTEGTLTQEEIDAALNTPTTLTFWTPLADIEDEVALFEAKYPKIDVVVENVGRSADQYTKMRTALQAGNGAPDVAQIDYNYISSFTLTDSLLDLAPYGAAGLASDFVDAAWGRVTQGDAIYCVPQDQGPMGFLYREDILRSAGITTPPATWEEFAEDAAAVKSATGSYLTNIAPANVSPILGFLSQAGAAPFSYDGDQTVEINLNSDEAKTVMAYWQDLIQNDLVGVDADLNDQWYQGLAQDKYASWISGAWAPVFLQGTVADTAGKWRAAQLPQWTDGEQASANWGGSGDCVLNTSENPIAAYELVKFLNHDVESATMFTQKQSLYPTLKSVLESSDFTDQPSEFFGGQKVNELFAEISTTVQPFEPVPFMDFIRSSFTETLGTAIAERGDLSAGLDAWQQAVVDYAQQQGFTVETN